MGDVLEFRPIGDETQKSDLDVRVLTPEEVESLRPRFESIGAFFPNPNASFCVGAVDASGQIVAYQFIQIQVHAEPMEIDHPYEAVFSRLIDLAEKELVNRCGMCVVYCFTPAGKVTRLAQMAGMKLEPWNVMSKIVGLPEGGSVQ